MNSDNSQFGEITTDWMHVAVGILFNSAGEVLISHRHEHLHQGGLWEFPGGKVEQGESAQTALSRELREELSIQTGQLIPLIRIPHKYADRNVVLDVWEVADYHGEVNGEEGQSIRWVDPRALVAAEFPAANLPIIHSIQLPSVYMISGDFSDEADLLEKLHDGLKRGVRLVQFRAKNLDRDSYRELAKPVRQCVHEYGARLLLNDHLDLCEETGADGVHLPAYRLKEYSQRPLASDKLLAVSTHSREELELAETLGADFVVLSPVFATPDHPQSSPLAWQGFAKLVETAVMPVYALGGMSGADIAVARKHGAQGIAAIRSYWGEK